MSLSRKARQQEQELEALEQQLYGKPAEAPAAPAEGSDTPQAEPPATDAATTDAPAAPVETPAAPAVSEETWEQRYKVLQGKYNAEVPSLQRDLRALTDKVKTFEAAAAQTPPEKLVKAEEVDQYGEQFIDMVQRAAEEKFAPERQQLTAKIDELEARLNNVAGAQDKATQAGFFKALNDAAPDWEAVDADEQWQKWLGEYDPKARRVRQSLLDDALLAHDAAYVASMISDWKAQRQARTPNLASLAAPSTAKANAPAAPTKKVWTKADVDAFYREAAKPRNGKYTQEEIVRIEQDIESAVREGRYKE